MTFPPFLPTILQSREVEALESRERMREVQRERNARVLQQLQEDDKRREEESKQKMLKVRAPLATRTMSFPTMGGHA